MLRLGEFRISASPRKYNITGGSYIWRSDWGYCGSFQFTSFPPTLRIAATSFSARQNICFLKMAWAAGAGTLHDSIPVREARNTPSGEPYSRSNRADSRAAMPGVKVSASQEREASSSTPRAYVHSNQFVKSR